MRIPIETERSLTAAVPVETFAALLADTEATLALFPKLRKLSPLGPDSLLIELRPIGSRVANISHEVAFAAKFSLDSERGELRWTPVNGKGNSAIEGLLRFSAVGDETSFSLRVKGDLNDVPVPLLYRPVAPAFIRGKFAALIDIFLERIRAAAVEHQKAVSKKPGRARAKAA